MKLKPASILLKQETETPNFYSARELELVDFKRQTSGVLATLDFESFAVLDADHPLITKYAQDQKLAVGNHVHYLSPLSLNSVLPYVRKREEAAPFLVFLGRRGIELNRLFENKESIRRLYVLWRSKEVDFHDFLFDLNYAKLARDLGLSKPCIYKWKAKTGIPRASTLRMIQKLYGIKLVVRI